MQIMIMFIISSFVTGGKINADAFRFKITKPKVRKVKRIKKVFKVKKIDAEALDILRKIIKRRRKIKSGTIKSKVDIRKNMLRIKGNMNIYFTNNKILIETFVLGIKISSLLIKNNTIYFKDYVKNKFKKKRASRNNIARYIPVKLSLKQFREMLKGAPPLIENYNSAEYDRKNKRLILKNSYEVQYLYLDSDKEITKIELYKKNKKRLEISLSKVKEKEGISYSSKIYFKDYKKNVRSKMKITDINFNIPLKNAIFNIK